MQLVLLLVLAYSTIVLPLASVAEFTFETRSETLRDGERIRGIRSRENKTFVLGGLFPVHLHDTDSPKAPCGEVRVRGLQRVEAMLYAIDRINADPQLLPGVELGYDIRDTCLSETLGLDEAIDLIITGSQHNLPSCDSERESQTLGIEYVPTSGIVGASGSRVSVPVASLGRLFNMPQVSYASTSPLLSDRTRYSYFYRTIPPDNLQVLAMVHILHRFRWNYVSFLYSDDAYGSAGFKEFVNASAKNGICIDLSHSVSPSFTEGDYEKLLDDLGNSKARVVIFFANEEIVNGVLERVNKNETLRRNFTWIASDGWAHARDLVRKFSDTAAGLLGVTPLTEYLRDFDEYISQLTINNNRRNEWFPEFFAATANCTLEEDCDNNTNVTGYEQDSFVPLVVEAVYTFAHALQDFLIDNCNSTDTAPFLWFKSNSTCLGQSRELNGTSLLEYLSRVNFTSISNHSIMFDESGSVQGFYEILNYQATFSEDGDITGYQFVSVGTWVSGNASESLSLGVDDLQFGLKPDGSLRTEPVESQCGICGPGMYIREVSGSCCAICEPCLGRNFSSQPKAKQCDSCLVEGEREMWGNTPLTGSNSCVPIPEISSMHRDPWAIPSLIFASIGLLSVGVATVIFGKHWKTPVIKSSSREQMILLLIGISCSFVLPFFYVAPPSIPICLVNRLGIWFCYSLMFGSLVVKAQRIARIFYGVKRSLLYTPLFARPIYQVIFTLIIVMVQIILIIISLALIPPKVLRILRYDQNSEDRHGLPEVVITCQKEETAVVAISLLYQTGIIVVATILGLVTFKFPKNFNEAKYVSFCAVLLFVVWVGLIPTYFATELLPEIQNAAISYFVVLSAFGILFIIFGPKLFLAVFHSGRHVSITQSSTQPSTPKRTENGIEMKQRTRNSVDFEHQ